MGTYALAVLLATLLCLAALTTAATPLPGSGSIEPMTLDLRKALKVERQITNRRLERRCREGRYWPQVVSVWRIPRALVGRRLGWQMLLRRRAGQLISRCLPARMRRTYNQIPAWRRQAWERIHGCEGSWSDSGDPYWGGLQMDRSFMRSYGGDALKWYGGLANVWPPFVQVVVADRAWRSRGFHPWPTCARRAGLI